MYSPISQNYASSSILIVYLVRLIAFCIVLVVCSYSYLITLGTLDWKKMEFIAESKSSRLLRTVLRQGAPPRAEYYEELFPLLRQLNFTHVLMEYEDMFPYSGELLMLRAGSAYSETTLKKIVELAESNNLEVIPLVQTFGHMEFVLKLPQFSMLREDARMEDTICPSDPRSLKLIQEMLTQVRSLHSHSKILHIGADEAYHIAKDERCIHRLRTELNNSVDRLKIDHISRVARIAKDLHFEKVWAWNDMYDNISVPLMMEYRLGELIVPVIWGYAENVCAKGYFPDGMFERFYQVFDELIFASAFKGANGQSQTFMRSSRYMANLISYYNLYEKMELFLSGKLSGMILTGWQRYNHKLPLCELLPAAIPCLVKQALYLQDWSNPQSAADFHDAKFMDRLNINESSVPIDALRPISYKDQLFHPPVDTIFKYGNFSGVDLIEKLEKLRLIKWKVDVTGGYDSQLRDQLGALKNEIEPILRRYFYNDTVTEWITQNMVVPTSSLLTHSSLPSS